MAKDPGGGVGAAAGAEFDFAVFEVVEELVPLGVGDVAILVAGSLVAAAGDERAVVFDDVVVVDGDVALGRVEVGVAEDLGGDVDRQPGGHGFGREDAAEVMWCDPCRGAVAVNDAAAGHDPVDQGAGLGGGDHRVDESLAALEQERQRRAVETFGVVVAAQQRDPT